MFAGLCFISFMMFYRSLWVPETHKHELSKYFEELTTLNLLYYGQGTSGYQLWFVISLAWSITILYLFFRLKKIMLLLILGLCLNLLGLFGQSYLFSLRYQ